MGNIYKLVDVIELNNAKNNVISFSRPSFEFKGSEGSILKFSKRIYKKYVKQGLNIKPSAKDLEDIRKWSDIFRQTYNDQIDDYDMITDSKIMFCLYMQSYCAYFTNVNLFDNDNRNNYLSKSKLKNKIAVIKINEEKLQHLHWRSKVVKGPYLKFEGDENHLLDFNCYLHRCNIKYLPNYNDYETLLKRYNSKTRYLHTWFDLLSEEFLWQQEERLIITLNSFEKNASRLGCDKVYNRTNSNSLEEKIYCNLIDAFYYGLNGPKYIDLQLDDGDIEILPLY